MQPNNNDPLNQSGQAPGMGQPGVPASGMPPQAPAVPDWQQGLGNPAAPAQPVQSVAPTAPAPTQPDPGMPSTPVVSQPVYGGMPPAGMGAPMPTPKRGFPKLVLVAVVLLVIVLGAVGYFVFAKSGSHQSANNAAQTSANNAKKTATALDTISAAALTVPVDMSGFQSDTGTGSDHSFLTTGSDSTHGGCELAFGTETATQLPGATIDDIVAPGIKSLKDNGVTVDGPKAETALILKNTAGQEYSLPTISYSFTQGTKNAKVVYSIAVTKDGNRTYVRRDCAVVGPLDNAKMTQLEQKAAQITVTASPQ